jgi:PAS domain S-box-containing protein
MSARAPFDVHPSLAPILNTVLDAVVVMTSEGRVVGWNGTAEQVFGWSSAEATDQLLVDLIVPPQHRAAHQAGLSRLASGGEARVLNRLIEISALCRDGKEIPIELSITTAPSGLHTVFVGFIRDITQRRAAEARTAQQALEARLMFEIAQLAAESDSFEEALQKTSARLPVGQSDTLSLFRQVAPTRWFQQISGWRANRDCQENFATRRKRLYLYQATAFRDRFCNQGRRYGYRTPTLMKNSSARAMASWECSAFP